MERRRAGERGTAIVEMALILPVFLLLVMGTLDFGRAIYARNMLANAARDGARFASVDPTNTACVKAVGARLGSTASLAPGDVAVSFPNGVDLDQPVTVTVSTTYRPLSAIIAGAIGLTSIPM